MKRYGFLILVVSASAVLAFSACAKKPQPQVPAGPGPGTQKTVTMQASSYDFKPNNIQAAQGDTLVFTIANTAGKKHNFTINDPQGNMLQSVELPPNKTTTVQIVLNEPGIYHFFCNKPFHESLGMKGQLEAAPR